MVTGQLQDMEGSYKVSEVQVSRKILFFTLGFATTSAAAHFTLNQGFLFIRIGRKAAEAQLGPSQGVDSVVGQC